MEPGNLASGDPQGNGGGVMGTKRMFANSIVDSDEFTMLSHGAQLLYFHLGLKADDDGFCSVLRILKVTELNGELLEELEQAGFIIQFDGGVVLIRHWNINNTLKSDRYHETRFVSFKKQVRIDENGVYSIMEPEWNQSGTDSEQSIAQYSQAQGSPEKVNQAQGSPGEGSPEGGGDIQKAIETAKRHGFRANQRVINVLEEEISKSSCEEVNSKIIREPSFRKRLELLGGTA